MARFVVITCIHGVASKQKGGATQQVGALHGTEVRNLDVHVYGRSAGGKGLHVVTRRGRALGGRQMPATMNVCTTYKGRGSRQQVHALHHGGIRDLQGQA